MTTSSSPVPAGKPLWRRVARQLRDTGYRLASPIDRLARGASSALLPPLHLRIYYYRTADPTAFVAACDGARAELVSRGLQPQHRVLDIGSGIGNLALGLAGYLQGGYHGLDIHGEAVAWCQQAITPAHPGFQFHHADVASVAYNADGRQTAAAFRFPFADQSFDVVFLGSVFTHLLPDAVAHYVAEIGRVLAPGGVCIASYFLVNDETRPGLDAGTGFMSFDVRHASGECRLHDAATPESAVALEETFVARVHAAAGLHIEDVRRGGWWRGAHHQQDVLTARREG